MTIQTANYLIERNGTNYRCRGDQLSSKMKPGDQFVLQRGGKTHRFPNEKLDISGDYKLKMDVYYFPTWTATTNIGGTLDNKCILLNITNNTDGGDINAVNTSNFIYSTHHENTLEYSDSYTMEVIKTGDTTDQFENVNAVDTKGNPWNAWVVRLDDLPVLTNPTVYNCTTTMFTACPPPEAGTGYRIRDCYLAEAIKGPPIADKIQNSDWLVCTDSDGKTKKISGARFKTLL